MKNLEKVFVGFTKDGKERILYRRYGTYLNGVTFTEFIDLETGETFEYSKVDNLRTFKETIPVENNKKYMTRRKIVKSYKLDRDSMMSITDLVIADICKVNNMFDINNSIESSVSLLEENVLMKKLNDLIYEDIRDHKIYYNVTRFDSKIFSGTCVNNIRSIELDPIEKIKPKKLILENAYKETINR